MTYKAIATFRDNGQVYYPGSKYPARGKETTPERVQQLMSSDNLMGMPVIAAEETLGAQPAHDTERRPRARSYGDAE